MKFNELVFDQSVIVQILWGEKKIEFTSKVLKHENEALYITAYIHNGQPLVFSVDHNDSVVCNLFADDLVNDQRISWRNISLATEEVDGAKVYCLKTDAFNKMSELDDRRGNGRIVISKKARIYDQATDVYTDIIVHDISDAGISFYAPTSYMPRSNQIIINFLDTIDTRVFDFRVECSIVRTANKAGNVFYGCRIVGENRDYLVYGFLKKLKKKSSDKL